MNNCLNCVGNCGITTDEATKDIHTMTLIVSLVDRSSNGGMIEYNDHIQKIGQLVASVCKNFKKE